MAYNTNELIKRSLKLIPEKKLMFIEDLCVYLAISKNCFYDHLLHENDEIKKGLQENRIKMKLGLRTKWYNSDCSTREIALYKLLGTKDECHRLNGSKQEVDHTSGGKPISPVINFVNGEDE